MGLNVNLSEQVMTAIDQKVTDLSSLMRHPPKRNFLAAVILRHLVVTLDRFADEGFQAFIQRWRELDFVRGKRALLMLANDQISGKVMGIDQNGLLVLNVNGMDRKFSSGELSLRVTN